jgi:hypothetical protein
MEQKEKKRKDERPTEDAADGVVFVSYKFVGYLR